jgi:hypothetical protein
LGSRPAADARSWGDQLDGAGDDGLQLFVDSAPPLQPLRVDQKHVDVFRADGLLPGDHIAVPVQADRDADGIALAEDGRRQRAGSGTRQTDILRASAGVQHCRHHDHGDDHDDHHHQPSPKAARSAALAHLAKRHQPRLSQTGHAATASRNSSDSFGG